MRIFMVGMRSGVFIHHPEGWMKIKHKERDP